MMFRFFFGLIMNPQPPEEQQQEPGGIHPPGAPGPRNMEPPPQNTLPPNNNIPVEPGMMPGGSMASAHQPDIYGSDFTNGLASLPLGMQICLTVRISLCFESHSKIWLLYCLTQ
ncbi:hypothetical protein L798_12055 [Zootermopsis nevadensis]|uniref:Uncharacterized protein n=1 Tax=Zootermopsis nevadensis TaxID=136037 RepID=A0A067RVJ6_ZOONE|nr:hypothetical protein L798_12055 [Zootermopsis nevadensis]